IRRASAYIQSRVGEEITAAEACDIAHRLVALYRLLSRHLHDDASGLLCYSSGSNRSRRLLALCKMRAVVGLHVAQDHASFRPSTILPRTPKQMISSEWIRPSLRTPL
uniref:hypothetical protein n=1 Tax=Bradyrhizobium guangdongense TaxID=1325090 RepID=UPI001AEC8964